jgi:GT2 family glycosyltransferase
MKPLDVSVIIVNWNTRDILRDCLRSVYEQTGGVTFEVIVVDNASDDGSAEMVKQEIPQVILIENKENRGFAAANNQGMAIANGRYILLLNPDTIVLDGAIQKSVVFADYHPDIAVVGCQVWLNEHEIQRTCFAFPSVVEFIFQKMGLRRLFPRSRSFGWIDYGWWDRTTPMDVDVVSGMFMLVRKSAIEQVGGMDEDYFVYAEETDWCFRFKKAGWKCVFTPTARIIHIDGGNKSTDLVKIKMYVQMQKSVLIFYKKRCGFASWLIAKLLFMFSMFIRYTVFGLLAILKRDDRSSKIAAQSLAAIQFHCFGVEPR